MRFDWMKVVVARVLTVNCVCVCVCVCQCCLLWPKHNRQQTPPSSHSLGLYSDQMISVRLDAYVFEIFSKCKVLVSAAVVSFVQSVILCLLSTKDESQQPSFKWCKKNIYRESGNEICRLRISMQSCGHSLSQTPWNVSLDLHRSISDEMNCGCRRSYQMIMSNVKANQHCRDWRWANNTHVHSFLSLRLVCVCVCV